MATAVIAASDDRVNERPLDESAPVESSNASFGSSCFVSLVLHAALIVVLGTWYLESARDEASLVLSSFVDAKPPAIEEPPREFEFTRVERPETGSLDVVGAAVESSVAPLESASVRLPNLTPTLTEKIDIQAPVMLERATAVDVRPDLAIRGSADVGVTGTLGALDRITQEILLSLAQQRTLVVWVFDQSGSMQAQRDAIQARFDRIYRELGLSEYLSNAEEVARDDRPNMDSPLLSAVMAFGEKITFRCEPTDDLSALRAAVDKIENDPSGVERVFSAVSLAVTRYQGFREEEPRRNVMIVVLTDEAGDDEANMEKALGACVRRQIPVYIVGAPAPFGRREVEVKYVDPDPNYDQTVRWIPVRQGPESAAVEAVSLGFSAFGGEPDRQLRLDSGFGPFHLTRLCVETGGIYFAVHPNREAIGVYVPKGNTPVFTAQLNRFFDPDMMRRYAPDYVTDAQYRRLLAENKARMALVSAAERPELQPMRGPRLYFPAFDEAAFKTSLEEAQRAAAVLQPELETLYAVLKQGVGDRERLHHPRWEAGFDLAIGRVLAVKARTDGYNHMLAKAKNGMRFVNEKNNSWRLAPVNDLSINSTLERMAAEARMYLERVVREHPDTPWAVLASLELNEPIGWEWREAFTPPPAPRREPPPNANNPPRRNNPAPVRLTKPKPVRQDVKL